MGIDTLIIWLAFAVVLVLTVILLNMWYQWTVTSVGIGPAMMPFETNISVNAP